MRPQFTIVLAAAALLANSVPSYAARLSYPSSPAAPRSDAAPASPAPSQAPAGSLEAKPVIPALTGPVVDGARVLSPAGAGRIEALAHELEQKTGAEIAVLTVDTVQPLDAFDYGQRVADTWKLGQAGKDNGLLLLVVVRDRQVRFFTGYGLEGILPDGRLGGILDEHVTPQFRKGDYDAGIYGGVRAAADVIAEDAGVELTGEPVRPVRRAPEPDIASLLVYLAFFILVIYLSGGRRRRRRYFPIFFGGGLGGGGFGGGFGGGGFGGGFGGGGFGGGGRFGGGGAGRGW